MEWKDYRLIDVLDALIDYRGKTPKKYNSGVPLITAKIIKNGTIGTPSEFIAFEDYEAWMVRGFPEVGDVVLTTEAPLGEVAQLQSRDIALAQRVVTLRGKKGILDNTFLKYFFLSHEGHQRLVARETGTTVTGIKQSELREVLITCPSYQTQRRIAAILSSLDDKIENNNRINRNLEAQAQALFKSWFVDFEPWGGKMPEDWKEYQLSELTDVIGGYSYKGAELMPSEDAMATIKNFDRKGYFKLDGYKEIQISGRFKNTQILNLFDVVVAHTDITQQADIIGNPAIILSKGGYRNIIMSMDLCKVQPTHYAISSAFLYCLLKDSRFKSHALGYVNGTTVLHMSKKALPEYKVFLPSDLSKVQELGDQLQNLYKRCSINLEENKRLAALRDTLLPKLMKGEIEL